MSGELAFGRGFVRVKRQSTEEVNEGKHNLQI